MRICDNLHITVNDYTFWDLKFRKVRQSRASTLSPDFVQYTSFHAQTSHFVAIAVVLPRKCVLADIRYRRIVGLYVKNYHTLYLYSLPTLVVRTCRATSFLRAKVAKLESDEMLFRLCKRRRLPSKTDEWLLVKVVAANMRIGFFDLAKSDKISTPIVPASEIYVTGLVCIRGE